MAANGSKKDTSSGVGTLWAVVDTDTSEVCRTSKGLLAVYVTREDARAARKAGRVRSEGTRVEAFDAAED